MLEKKNTPNNFTLFQKIAAISVHLFTSFGIVVGFWAILAVAHHQFKQAFIFLAICQFIDGVDGTFARLFNVKKVLPNFSGATIDYVIDFTTYAIIPAYLMYEAAIVPSYLNMYMVIAVLLTSAIYYGKEGMVSSDLYFVGFPVLWNIAAFYLVCVIPFHEWFGSMGMYINFFVIILLCILHFVPIKFPYPSRTMQFRWLHLSNTLLFVVANSLLLYLFPSKNTVLSIISVATCLYFFGISVYTGIIAKK